MGSRHLLAEITSLAAQYEPAGLDEAITLLREAVAAVPEQSPDRPGFLSNLGAALLSQFERTNELAHLDEAIAIGRVAMDTAPSSSSSRPEYLSNLSGALRTRFDCVGRLDDLDAAVIAGREAVESTSPRHYNRRLYLSNLSAALGARFEQTGQSDDLDEAVAAGRIAVTDGSPSEPDRPLLLLNLSGALRRRFDHTEWLPDLAEAVSTARDAVDAVPPDHPDRPMLLANLAGALGTRFSHTEELADLDMAIALEHEAVEATSPEHHHYAAYLSNYGASLGRRFEHTGRRADLDAAITISENAAAASPPEHPGRARCLSNLGAMLQYRYTLTRESADLDAAINAFRDATRVVSAPPRIRMLAGQRWGHAAADAQRFDSAADGFDAAVTLMPLLAWHGLPPDTRQDHLTTWSGLAADAAACAVRAGRHERAVELLDAGRSVLWTQTLNLRTNLSDLAEAAAAAGEPELVDRLGEVRRLLDAPLPDTVAPADKHWQRLYVARRHAVDDRIHLAREFDSLLARVRALSGFEHFLLPEPFSQLGTAAADGPVVIVNTSRHGCHALVIEPTGMQVLDLPELIHSHVIDQTRRHRQAVASSASPRSPRDIKGSPHSNDDTVLDILRWLWDTVAQPVLSHLGHTGQPPADVAWPRLWWCPAGPMTMLPLHAAGRHRDQRKAGTDAETVPDLVVSSYTPTLTSLLRARSAMRPAGTPRVLAVGMPTTPDAGDLPHVPRELDGIQDLITTRLQNPIRDRTNSAPADSLASADGQPSPEGAVEPCLGAPGVPRQPTPDRSHRQRVPPRRRSPPHHRPDRPSRSRTTRTGVPVRMPDRYRQHPDTRRSPPPRRRHAAHRLPTRHRHPVVDRRLDSARHRPLRLRRPGLWQAQRRQRRPCPAPRRHRAPRDTSRQPVGLGALPAHRSVSGWPSGSSAGAGVDVPAAAAAQSLHDRWQVAEAVIRRQTSATRPQLIPRISGACRRSSA